MSEEQTPAPREGETVPVPDKGGWIDGETGPVFGGPPPAPPEPPITRREGETEPKPGPEGTPQDPRRGTPPAPQPATPIRKTPKEANEGR